MARRSRTPKIDVSARPSATRGTGDKTQSSSLPLPKLIGRIAAAIVIIACLFGELPGLDPVGTRMFGIFLAAIILWVTEAIPLAATAVLIIFLEVLLISDQALLPVGAEPAAASHFFGALANPVIILFLGGFMLADGASKYKLDRALSAVLLKPFLGSPRLTILGIMLISAVMSMFMSNTATTATMFAVMMPVIMALPEGKARTGIALSIPVAANVGGMGTPVGTPPNAIALGALEEVGMSVSFLDWMLAAVPLMLLTLLASWLFIVWRYIPGDAKFTIDTSATFQKDRKAMIFYIVAAATILLWMTEPLHGVSSNTVGFLPVVVLLVTGVMTGDDVKALDWPVLWLVAGGIALGAGVGSTGLDKWLLGGINWSVIPVALLILVLALVGWVVSNVISHSASANLLIPMGIGLATTIEASSIEVAIVLALGCSLGMCLPISTPPNAIAYATGTTPTKEMVIVGVVVGVVGVVLLTILAPLTWGLFGVV
ncbi:MAG: DASS family sodium-coupled anion symporter [Actinomycetaceae bacterium]|nr:DASS family sodium-coupled anion symporter [Actinomycetaceae bacterium]